MAAVTRQVFSAGVLQSTDSVTVGNPAAPIAVGVNAHDPVVYVSKSGKASDENDGLSPGTAKATIAGALSAFSANGVEVRLMTGTWVEDVDLLGQHAISLEGIAPGVTVVKGASAGSVVQLDGHRHRIRNLTIDGDNKTSVTGLMVRGYSAATPEYNGVRQLKVENVRVTQCKEGVRFGHYSTLNGVAGDGGDADITGSQLHNIWIEYCDYGWIEDGQNILENEVDTLRTTEITYHHVYLPRGGYFDATNYGLGATLTAGYAKIKTLAGSVVVRRSRSENNGGINVPYVQTSNADTRVVMEHVEVTNFGSDPAHIDLDFGGGKVALVNVVVDGMIGLGNTDIVALSVLPAGGYERTGNQNTKREVIVDPLNELTRVSALSVSSDNNDGVTVERAAMNATSEVNVLKARERDSSVQWGNAVLKATRVGAGTESAIWTFRNMVDGTLRGGGFGRAAAAPTEGTWSAGDVLLNTSPASGGFVGWVCVTGGTPGTWKTFGAISA